LDAYQNEATKSKEDGWTADGSAQFIQRAWLSLEKSRGCPA